MGGSEQQEAAPEELEQLEEEKEDEDDDDDDALNEGYWKRWVRGMVARLLWQLRGRRRSGGGWTASKIYGGKRRGKRGYVRLGWSNRRRRIRGAACVRIRWWRRRPFYFLRSPRALMARLRDAYVRLLLAAESQIALSAPPGSLSMGPFAFSSSSQFPASLPKEYDPKVLLHLYASNNVDPPLPPAAAATST